MKLCIYFSRCQNWLHVGTYLLALKCGFWSSGKRHENLSEEKLIKENYDQRLGQGIIRQAQNITPLNIQECSRVLYGELSIAEVVNF